MVDLPDLNAPAALACDRAIFTSLPSPTGEGYRLVAWSNGVRPEERVELTRRAPSHGSLCNEEGGSRALLQFHLQATGRLAWGIVRVSGSEHTRRGGGRVWTDFVLADADAAESAGLHPDAVRAALAEAPSPKPPRSTTPLDRLDVVGPGVDAPAAGGGTAVAAAAAMGSNLADGRPCVVAAGPAMVEVFELALRMVPACRRGRIDACAGLRFSTARGVLATVVESIGPDVVRATRGQGVDCLDLVSKPAPPGGALAPWFALMSRWWSEQRGADAAGLAGRLRGAWTDAELLDVAALCENIDRGAQPAGALGEMLAQHPAA